MNHPGPLRTLAALAGLLALPPIPPVLAATPGTPPPGITVQPIPGDQRPLKIAGVQISPDGTAATITFQSEMGIFAFHLEPLPEKVTKVTLLVEKQAFCEGLSYSPKGGREIDLRHTEGVTVQKRNQDLAVEITGKAFELLKAGGKVQFVNQYR